MVQGGCVDLNRYKVDLPQELAFTSMIVCVHVHGPKLVPSVVRYRIYPEEECLK